MGFSMLVLDGLNALFSRSLFKPMRLCGSAKFANMFMRTEAEGIIGMNLSRFHDIEPVYLL